MSEYIIAGVGILLLVADNLFNFLSKTLVAGVLTITVFAVLHITIKDAVKEAIIESRESDD